MTTGTITPARAISSLSRPDPQPKRAEAPTIQHVWYLLTRGLLVLVVISTLLIMGVASRPVELTNPLQSPLKWVNSLKGMPHQECRWDAQIGSNDWYACEVVWQGWHVMLYGTGNKITHAFLRPPSSIPLADLVQWYGRWDRAVHYQHLHHLKWDQLEVYLYVSSGEAVSVMSSQVNQIQIKL